MLNRLQRYFFFYYQTKNNAEILEKQGIGRGVNHITVYVGHVGMKYRPRFY